MNLFGSNRNSSTPNKRERYLHNLSKGDHVVRWDRIVVYPIQVHGIVLSASDDVVTIVDFGLTATPPSPPPVEHKGHGKFSSSLSSVQNGTSNESNMNSDDSSLPLEEMINHEDRAMIKTCESHRHEIMGPDRINILVLTEEKDIKSWKKVNYTIEKKKKKKQGKFQWWWDHDNDNDNDNDNTDNANGKSGNKEKDDNGENIKMGTSTSIRTSTATSESKDSDDIIKENCSYEFSGSNADDGAAIAVPPSEEEEGKEMQSKSGNAITGTNSQETKNSSNGDDTNNNNNNNNSNDKDTSSIQEHNAKKAKTTESHPTITATSTNTITINKSKNKNNKNKDLPEPLLTRSDPTTIVLARVRYLVSNPHVLPPHHIFYSNSECIAVWCKTGVWSTLQASIYLHSTAAGNFKSAVTAAAAVSGSTVTTTVPASGIGGWFGMTTTATVSLVSVQPWIIPALAGYGIIAVGGPYIVLRKCHEHWRRATTDLNDKFWSELDADVYVEAIKSWSGLD